MMLNEKKKSKEIGPYYGNKSNSFYNTQQNDLFIKNLPFVTNHFVRYSNENPNIILNKNTNNLPLSYYFYIYNQKNM
jgi:hypothetical protein